MKFSLGSWAFTYGPYEDDPISFDQTAIRLSQAGYDGIEVGGFPPHVTLEKYPSAKSRAELRQFLHDLNLSVSGYAADFGTLDPTVGSNKQPYLELFSRNLEMCKDLGADALRVDSVAAPGSISDADYPSAMSRLAEVWHQAAEIAQVAEVIVVWEFEPAFVFNKPSEIKALLDHIGHPHFQVLFDTSHAYMCCVVGARQHGERETLKGGIAELLKMLDGHIGHVHLIDSDGTLYQEETSTHAPFGQGRIDFHALAPNLSAVPGIEWWCVDMCFWPDAWDLVEPSLKFIQNLQSRLQD